MSRQQKVIDRASLEAFGVREGVAVVSFQEGIELQLCPEWRQGSVRRIAWVRLCCETEIVAQVHSGCFWTAGEISQAALGDYCAFAIDLEREVYRHYRTGKIDEDEWQNRFREYWKIVIKSRQIVTALSGEQLPTMSHLTHDAVETLAERE